MSSYDSLSPVGGSSPILEGYEPQYFCQGQHEQENQLSNGDGAFWTSQNMDNSLDKHQIHSGDMYGGQYMTRNYGYEVVHADYEAYGALGALSQQTGSLSDCRQAELVTHAIQGCCDRTGAPTTFVRVVKRRSTANKKERRRTQSINTAFSDLRECIPNVPADTKLSKIKTLRLATSYISYLMGVLDGEGEPLGGFRAELGASHTRRGSRTSRSIVQNTPALAQDSCQGLENHRHTSPSGDNRRSKGRTGWPQHVWALELKQEQNI